MEAETFSSAPGLRRRVLSKLLAHLLDTFAGAVPEQLAGAPRTLTPNPHIPAVALTEGCERWGACWIPMRAPCPTSWPVRP